MVLVLVVLGVALALAGLGIVYISTPEASNPRGAERNTDPWRWTEDDDAMLRGLTERDGG